MNRSEKTQLTLRTKILLFTGSVIIIIMFVASVALLVGFRSLIVENAIHNAESITRAFKIPVLNDFLKYEAEEFPLQEKLGYLINNYKTSTGNIKYIEIADNSGKIIAHTDWTNINSLDSLNLTFKQNNEILWAIYRNKYGKVLETSTPIAIAGKKWAIMKIGFDTQSISLELRNYFFLFLFSTIFTILAALLVLFFISRKLTSALEDLVEMLDNFDFELDTSKKKMKSTNETAFIYEKFENMQRRIQKSKEDLINAQKQIYQAQKLASIGKLSAGIAHEINNPLNGIKSCLYSINKNPEDFERNKQYIDFINEGLTNIELIVNKLLGFARQKSNTNEPVNICENIRKVISLIEYRIKEKQVYVSIDCKNIPNIKGDAQLLQEVFLNLIINSLDAVDTNGEIKISSHLEKDYVAIEFYDNGIGIEKKDLDKIFDPFFTTKEPGKGTGLGLSVSLGIIENMNGTIKAKSKQGFGTIFTVKLPINHN